MRSLSALFLARLLELRSTTARQLERAEHGVYRCLRCLSAADFAAEACAICGTSFLGAGRFDLVAVRPLILD